jgi:polyhydroxybutyrate depolymerase
MRLKLTSWGLGGVLAVCALVGLAVVSSAGSAGAASGSVCALSSHTGLRTIALTNQGQSRPFLLYVPQGYSRGTRVPVVFDLHGSGSNGAGQLSVSQIEPVADSHGFAVLAPNGAVPASSTGYYWNVPGVPLINGHSVPRGTPSDERYLTAVLDKAEQTICVDTHRVYMTGFSGGARMTSQMACDHSQLLAAVAPVAGLRAGIPVKRAGTWSPKPSSCQPRLPVPILTFHGTADMTNPYAGNDDARWGYSVMAALRRWAVLDHCSHPPTRTQVTQTTTLVRYSHCNGGASVSLLRSAGAGHSWPGGTSGSVPTDSTIHATTRMWRFFSHHSR